MSVLLRQPMCLVVLQVEKSYNYVSTKHTYQEMVVLWRLAFVYWKLSFGDQALQFCFGPHRFTT